MQSIFRRSTIPLLVAYGCLAALALAMFVLARGFPGAHMGPAGPGFFPQVIAGLLLLLCVLGVLELRSDVPKTTRVPLPVVAAMGLSLGYIATMFYIGYYPSTFLFALAVMSVLRKRVSWARLILDSIAITACSYVFFNIMIDAHLPAGVLFG
jgi:Tripartite tricarboxylate transporter TctB family